MVNSESVDCLALSIFQFCISALAIWPFPAAVPNFYLISAFVVFFCLSDEDHFEHEEDEDEGEDEPLLQQEEGDPESMELDQAPAAVPVPAADELPVKRKRGRPPKHAPKLPPTPSKSARVTAKAATGERADQFSDI